MPSLVTKSSVVPTTKKYHQSFKEVLNHPCDLDSNPTFHSYLITKYKQTKLWMQTDWQFKKYTRNCHIWIVQLWPHCTLDCENSKTFLFLCMTLWLMMADHHYDHTKSGYKRFVHKICRQTVKIWTQPMNGPCTELTHIDRLKKALRPSQDQAYELTLYRQFEEGLAALTGPNLWTDLWIDLV